MRRFQAHCLQVSVAVFSLLKKGPSQRGGSNMFRQHFRGTPERCTCNVSARDILILQDVRGSHCCFHDEVGFRTEMIVRHRSVVLCLLHFGPPSESSLSCQQPKLRGQGGLLAGLLAATHLPSTGARRPHTRNRPGCEGAGGWGGPAAIPDANPIQACSVRSDERDGWFLQWSG